MINILLSQATSLGEVFDELFEVGVLAEPEVLVVCGGVAFGVALLQWKVWPIVRVGGGAHWLCVGEAGWLASEED